MLMTNDKQISWATVNPHHSIDGKRSRGIIMMMQQRNDFRMRIRMGIAIMQNTNTHNERNRMKWKNLIQCHELDFLFIYYLCFQ